MDLISSELQKTGSYNAPHLVHPSFGVVMKSAAEPSSNENIKNSVVGAALATVTNINSGTAASEAPPAAKKRKQATSKPKAARKPKKVTKKDLKEKLKKATDLEMIQLFEDIFEKNPDVIPIFNEFLPAKMEKPKADDPILHKCCFCSTTDSEEDLKAFEDDIKICTSCNTRLYEKGDLTRTDACSYFGFSKKEIKDVPHRTGTHGFYGSVIYLYSVKSCVKAVKTKYGSMYLFAKSNA